MNASFQIRQFECILRHDKLPLPSLSGFQNISHCMRLLFMVYATSEASGEPAHRCSLARALVVCKHAALKLTKGTDECPCAFIEVYDG